MTITSPSCTNEPRRPLPLPSALLLSELRGVRPVPTARLLLPLPQASVSSSSINTISADASNLFLFPRVAGGRSSSESSTVIVSDVDVDVPGCTCDFSFSFGLDTWGGGGGGVLGRA
jgi:hypothetical protein